MKPRHLLVPSDVLEKWPYSLGSVSSLQVLQIMLYLPKYGEISLATIALSQISNIKNWWLETNHTCRNIIIAQKSVENCQYIV